MPTVTLLGTMRLGAEPFCDRCGAGATVSFNWSDAREQPGRNGATDVSNFIRWKPLRRGYLYRCNVCESVWHLDGDAARMTYVDDQRLKLIFAWDREPIRLPDDIAEFAAGSVRPRPTCTEMARRGGSHRVRFARNPVRHSKQR